MFTTAEKTTKPTATVQKQAAGMFFARSHSESFFGGSEKAVAPSTFIQPKLTVSHPADAQEQEADQMARQVMAMPEPQPVSAGREEPENIQRQEEETIQRSDEQETLHRSEEPETIQTSAAPAEKLHPFAIGNGSTLSRSEDELQARAGTAKEPEKLHTKQISRYQTDTVHRAKRGPPNNTGPPEAFEQTLNATRGSGSPMSPDIRTFMESRFGADFSGVRIHTDETAMQMAQTIHAHAFAYGNDIYFNSGKYAPSTTEGKTLLAHELTHTIQQGTSRHVAKSQRAGIRRKPLVNRMEKEGREKEIQAKKTDRSVMTAVQHRTPPQLQRGFFGNFTQEGLLQNMSDRARSTRGYTLLTVLLGKDPITNKPVARSVENILKGFMTLSDAGEAQYNRLQESGAIAKATSKINAAIATLGFTWAYIKGLFTGLWNSLHWSDIADPGAVFTRIANVFMAPLNKLVNFAVTVVSAVFEVILDMMGFPFDMVNKLIGNVKMAWNSIKAHPVDFFLNLLRAIKQGFSQFFDRFPIHLKNGLTDWFFGQLKGVGITRPADLSGKNILKLVLQVLDVSVEKIWQKLATKIGPEKVEKIRGALDKAEEAWTFMKDIQQRGLVAVWDHISTQLSNLWNTVVESATKWVKEKIIGAVTAKLLSMLDPTGIMAVINACMGLYRAIQSFIENFKKVLAIVNSFVEGIGQIANGNTKKAADTMEASMARSIPVMISFLANQVGLGHIGDKLVEIIKSLRKKVDKALDWLVDKAVTIAGKVVQAGRAGIQKLKDWWNARVDFKGNDNKEHKIYFKGETENADMIIESAPMKFEEFLREFMPIDEAKTPPAERAKVMADREKASALAIDIDKKKRQQGLSDEEKAAALSIMLLDLSEILKHYFGHGKADNQIYNRGMHNDFAVESDAISLDKGIGYGSPPGGSLPPIYQSLNKRRKPGGSAFYVRGHLINDNLGGKGVWANMTPLPASENTRFEQEIESRMKRAMESGATICVNVKANYNRTVPGDVLQKMNGITATAEQKEDLIDILTNEQHVPLSLTIKSNILNKNGDKWEKGPAVADTEFTVNLPQKPVLGDDGYCLSDTPKKPAPVNINGGNAQEYNRVGLTQSEQQQLKSALKARKAGFGSINTLLNESGIHPDTINGWFTEPVPPVKFGALAAEFLSS